MGICLNMIVKDEAPRIERCLRSVLGFVDRWLIVDTGSTDGTQDVIRETMKGIPGQLHSRPWIDFAANRSQAIVLAQSFCRPNDFLLFLDADDFMFVPPGYKVPQLTQDLYELDISYGGTAYRRPALVKASMPWRYEGVLHEFVECDKPFTRGFLSGPTIIIGGKPETGTREKYEKHAQILRQALTTEMRPHMRSRYQFYLAQSYKDAGMPRLALKAYERRAEMGGFDEEVYYSLLTVGRLALNIPEEQPTATDRLLRAYQARPMRAEAIGELVALMNRTGKPAAAHIFARRLLEMPKTGDSLFVEPAYLEWYGQLEMVKALYALGDNTACVNLCDHMRPFPVPPHARAEFLRYRSMARRRTVPAIALYRPGAIGDIIMTLNLIKDFKAANPGRELHYYCSGQIADQLGLVMRDAGVDEVHNCDAEQMVDYERVISLVGYPLAEGYPEQPMRRHLVEYFAAEMGLKDFVLAPRARSGQYVGDEPYLTLQVKPGWSKYKGWPYERWQAVVNALPDLKFKHLAVAGEPVIEGAERVEASLLEALCLIECAQLHVGVDSFGQHAAHYLGVPSVVVWGSTQASAAGYPESTNISLGLPCQPCFREDAAISRMPRGPCINPPRPSYQDDTPPACTDGITVDMVVAAIRSKMAALQDERKAA